MTNGPHTQIMGRDKRDNRAPSDKEKIERRTNLGLRVLVERNVDPDTKSRLITSLREREIGEEHGR